MQPTSLRARVLASLTLISAASAQVAATAKPSAVVPPSQGTPAAADAALEGLPKFLLPVPGGEVEMGLDWEQFVDAACQVVMPTKPKDAVKFSAKKVTEGLRHSAQVLGRRQIAVDPFLLARHPVTNKQYEIFVLAVRASGKEQRVPLIWWKEGCPKDYLAKLPEVKQQFPNDPDSVIHYWERHGHEVPYKLADEKGRSTADEPVTFVSWRDCNAFAAWLGMRLPTEAEFTRAMRGDNKEVWPLAGGQVPATAPNAKPEACKDAYTEKLLELLQMDKSSNRVLKPVGSVAAAVGPYGHADMYGQVWQLVAALGYGPINGKDAFDEDWKRLQKDKVGSLVSAKPTWAPDKVVAKSGSYLSFQEPIQLLIDARAPMQTYDVLESVGFRLAKSMQPGYDMLYSLMRGGFSRAAFAEGQEIDMTAQAGAEHYELGADGFPTAYDAISFAPVGWLSMEKTVEFSKLAEHCQETPMLIGALAMSAPLVEPKVAAGCYSLLWHKEGIPKELAEALKQGHKEVKAALKDKPKAGDDAAPDDKGDDKADDKGGSKGKKDKNKKSDWRSVIGRFGLVEKDLEAKECANGTIGFMRYDGVEVPTDKDSFLLCAEGKAVAAVVAETNKSTAGTAFAPEFAITPSTGKGKEGKAVAAFHVGVPLLAVNNHKFVDFRMHVTLDRPAPTADKPWRLPK